MSGNHLAPSGGAQPTWPAPQHGGGDYEQTREGAGDDAASIWQTIRRNAFLIVACIALAGAAAALVTARMTPVYEATASIRIDDEPSQITAVGGVALWGTNTLATELEMLRSRQLHEGVMHAVGYQLHIESPRDTERGLIFDNVSVSRAAEPGRRRLVQTSRGRFALLGPMNDTIVHSIAPGRRVKAGGLSLKLAPTAARYRVVELQILSLEDAMDELELALDVSQRNREAGVVDVRVRDADAALARDVANSLVNRFIDSRQGARELEARETLAFLREQLERVEPQLVASEFELRRFREGENIVDLGEEASNGVTRRAELLAERNRLHAERQAFNQLLQTVRAGERSGGGASAYRRLLAFPTLVRSGMATDVLTALTAAEDRRDDLLARRTSQDPDVVRLNARIAQLQGQIQGLVSTYMTGLTEQVTAYDELLRQSDTELESIPSKEIRLAALERNARGTEATYSMLQTRLKEAEIAAAATDQSVRLMDTALLPREPISPRPVINLVLALVAGAMLGVSGALLRERADGSLHTRRQLLLATGVPVLGIVPRLRPRGMLAGSLARVGGRMGLTRWTGGDAREAWVGASGAPGAVVPPYDPDALEVFAEAHARLVTNVAFMSPDKRPAVLLFTSALPGDGKTTVAGNFALALSRTGKRVLLIDADLRGGRVARMLSMPVRQPGFADVLAGRADVAQVLVRLGVSGQQELHAVVAGDHGDATPAQLLGSARAREFIDWARSEYDAVVIDTPPVTIVADATVLTPVADGVVLVARSGVTEREALEFAVEQLRIVRAPLLGAVLNDVDLQRDVRYDGAYRYYKPYGGATPQRGIA